MTVQFNKNLIIANKGLYIGYKRTFGRFDSNDQLKGVDLDVVYIDTESKQNELKALIDFSRAGDTILVQSIGILSDSIEHLYETIQTFLNKQVTISIFDRKIHIHPEINGESDFLSTLAKSMVILDDINKWKTPLNIETKKENVQHVNKFELIDQVRKFKLIDKIDLIKQVKSDKLNGLTLKEIQKKYNICEATVYNYANFDLSIADKLDKPQVFQEVKPISKPVSNYKGSTKKVSSEDIVKIQRRIANGENIKVLAYQYKVHPETIRNYLRAAPASPASQVSEVKPEKTKNRRKLDIDIASRKLSIPEIEFMYTKARRGISKSVIASLLNVYQRVVQHHLKFYLKDKKLSLFDIREINLAAGVSTEDLATKYNVSKDEIGIALKYDGNFWMNYYDTVILNVDFNILLIEYRLRNGDKLSDIAKEYNVSPSHILSLLKNINLYE